MHGHILADVNVAGHNFANGHQQLFRVRAFHNVTDGARAQAAFCKDFFLKGRIDKDQQAGSFGLERLHKFQAVADAQAQRGQQHLRLALDDLVARVTNVARFAADNHVRLRIEIIAHPAAKQRMLLQDQDACF